ncbi:quinone-dependent dihydroorotate dehydrogenase [Micrococcus sp.]|uniref:quinone-dependent dihydroorotate dehydrogenase n=1 Tax=Micrococcus sp. TaxID=1271 RepID=UPI002A911A15|nr:quinone-dependent dihydroorotate dehydrogenase [Micrococcus sp.]MDY6055428.1 quinone-dependent dihydroorotate dehydrogenase [Micrococcus sp.]
MRLPSPRTAIDSLLTSRAPRVYPPFFRAVFSGMDPETAHHIGFDAIRAVERTGVSTALRAAFYPDPLLARTVMGLRFPSPFGLAAGFDKDGRGTSSLTDLGFGHIEVGTITARPQDGNPRPRLFRIREDLALVNRMGFNNDGAAAVAPRLARTLEVLERRHGANRPILGVNIGKTRTTPLEEAAEDYRKSTALLAPHADYLAVNVSSPNTPGLRTLQEGDALERILEAVREEADARVTGRRVPLTVKIAPDLSDEAIAEVAELVVRLGVDGVIATNTTVERTNLTVSPERIAELGEGGLSGVPLAARAREVLVQLRAALPSEVALISVGGVTTPEDVADRLSAGADLVQGYTAFLYEGPFWAGRINAGLARDLRR